MTILKFKGIVLLSIGLLVFSCSPKMPDESTVKKSLEEMSSLGTIEYDLSKILIVDDVQWYSIGDRKALITLKANLVAGIDFKKIKINKIEGKEIHLELPVSEIIYLNIPPDKIKHEVLKSDFLRSTFENEELNEIQQLGEKEIKSKIKELGILDEASKNAEEILQNWLTILGFDKVQFLTSTQQSKS